jgi:formylglycine-generating enzyme required for sulfatase activity
MQYLEFENSEKCFISIEPISKIQYQKVMNKWNIEKSLWWNAPIGGIDMEWKDAERFCIKLSKQIGKNVRLPNGQQWEYANKYIPCIGEYWGEDYDCFTWIYEDLSVVSNSLVLEHSIPEMGFHIVINL